MYLIRQNNFGIEIIKYHEQNLPGDENLMSSGFSFSAENIAERKAEINLFRSLNVDSEGRDYLMQNNSRAYFKILEYGTCNNWTHFVTFTIDKKKMDRFSGQDVLKNITAHFAYFKQYIYSDFKYLLVPELHHDGAVHFHGLVYAPDNVVPMKHFGTDFKTRKALYRNDWFFDRIGANRFIKIDNETPYITYYLVKYIQKAMDQKICCHRYYLSQGLKGYRVFKNDVGISIDLLRFVKANRLAPSFSNDFIQKYEIPGMTIENVLEDCIDMTPDQLEQYNQRRLYHRMKNYIIRQEQQESAQEKRLAEGLPLFTDQNNTPLWVTIRRKAADLAKADVIAAEPPEDVYEFVQDDFFDDIQALTSSQGI